MELKEIEVLFVTDTLNDPRIDQEKHTTVYDPSTGYYWVIEMEVSLAQILEAVLPRRITHTER